MGNELFQLTTVTRLLDDGVRLTEILGVPEVSSVETSERHCLATLRVKAKTILESAQHAPPLSLFRRRLAVNPQLDEVEISFTAPRRCPAWQSPVTLRLPIVRWIENELHHAYIPSTGVLVYASRADLIPARLANHTRLILSAHGQRNSLQELARMELVRSLAIGQLEVTVAVPTPRQIAQQEGAREESLLESMAEELPPFITKSPPSTRNQADPPFAFAMETELARLAEALSGPLRRSVLLVGPAGSGKTALVRELARRRREFGFTETPFWSTSGPRLMTGPVGFGMWQDRCQKLCRELATNQGPLHAGNLIELLETGKANSGEESVGGFLRSWIARGEITVIAECTQEQLGVIERLEPHLLGAFSQMRIPERTAEQTRAIIEGVFRTSPGPPINQEDLPITEQGLNRLHLLHRRYATYSANPGRAVRFLRNILADLFPSKRLEETRVVQEFSRETGLPLVLLDDQVPLNLDQTRSWFTEKVIGQPDAVNQVLDLLAVTKARLARPRKPLASLLFIGPTGTGKTETAKALATFLFGDPARLARFNLNEFSDPVAVHRLIGGPGSQDAEGLLTARVREQPFSVLLLDEFEKADPSFFDLLLQILGDGRLTDAAGRVADFCNSVVVMTSNLGSQGFQRGPSGFRADGATTPDPAEHFSSAVQNFLRPEIFNRFDAVVPFGPLPPDIIRTIARRQIDLVLNRDGLRLRSAQVDLNPAVIDYVARRGYDERYGARPLKRALERDLVVPLAEALSGFENNTPLRVTLTVSNGELDLQVARRTENGPLTKEGDQAQFNLTDTIVARRRRIGRMLQGAAVTSLENRLTLLNSLLQRRIRAGKKPAQADGRLRGLAQLRKCLEQVKRLAERAQSLEDTAVESLYAGERLQNDLFEDELGTLATEFRNRQREVFRLQQTDPDNVLLALYSAHQGVLLQFATAYASVAEQLGKIIGIEILTPPPSGRTSNIRYAREMVEDQKKFFASPPDRLLGIIMQLRGDLFFQRFHSEQGRHEITEKNVRYPCLIETAPTPPGDYQPPEAIERKGAPAIRGADLIRLFDREKKEVRDSRQRGAIPWLSPGLDRVILALTEEALNRDIEEATT